MPASLESTVEVTHNTRRVMLSTEQTVSNAQGHSPIIDHSFTVFMSVLAVFAPLKQMMLALLFLVVVDTITGIWGAFSTRQKFTSRKLSRTIAKTFVYLITICVVHVANKYMLSTGEFSLPLDTLIVSFIALTELKSIFENLQKIQKQPLLQFLIDKISADTSQVAERLDVKPAEALKSKEKKGGASKRQR